MNIERVHLEVCVEQLFKMGRELSPHPSGQYGPQREGSGDKSTHEEPDEYGGNRAGTTHVEQFKDSPSPKNYATVCTAIE